MMRAMLVDDHNVFRECLALVLERHTEFKECVQARSLAEAREVLGDSHRNLDLTIVDLDLAKGAAGVSSQRSGAGDHLRARC
jgi:DNA-binding NarL/FixJ family response regulator